LTWIITSKYLLVTGYPKEEEEVEAESLGSLFLDLNERGCNEDSHRGKRLMINGNTSLW
jgi:hypothetical protein